MGPLKACKSNMASCGRDKGAIAHDVELLSLPFLYAPSVHTCNLNGYVIGMRSKFVNSQTVREPLPAVPDRTS